VGGVDQAEPLTLLADVQRPTIRPPSSMAGCPLPLLIPPLPMMMMMALIMAYFQISPIYICPSIPLLGSEKVGKSKLCGVINGRPRHQNRSRIGRVGVESTQTRDLESEIWNLELAIGGCYGQECWAIFRLQLGCLNYRLWFA